MRKHRPSRADLEAVPWSPPQQMRYVSEMFYGLISIGHYDDGIIREVGKRLAPVLETLREELGLRGKFTLRTEWIHAKDGTMLVDARMDPATGEWERPHGG